MARPATRRSSQYTDLVLSGGRFAKRNPTSWLDASCRLVLQFSRHTCGRKAPFDKPGGCSIGGAGKAGLLPADCYLELTWLNYRAAVVCDHSQLARIDFEVHNTSLAWLQMHALHSSK